jgi:hypothetical protein
MIEEQERIELDLENEYLDLIFRGTISILRGITELKALGLDEAEAKSLAYTAARLGIGRSRGKRKVSRS